MAERAWSGIARFYDNCAKKTPGKKGYPKFKKFTTSATVEYKTSGWNGGLKWANAFAHRPPQLSEDRREITFSDGLMRERLSYGEPATYISTKYRKLSEYELFAERMGIMSNFV